VDILDKVGARRELYGEADHDIPAVPFIGAGLTTLVIKFVRRDLPSAK
jgi:hypothetical protein